VIKFFQGRSCKEWRIAFPNLFQAQEWDRPRFRQKESSREISPFAENESFLQELLTTRKPAIQESSSINFHMETPAIVRHLNKRLGDSLGNNYHGQPLYKWIYSEEFFHWMQDIKFEQNTADPNDIKASPVLVATKQPSGLILMEPSYTRRKVCPDMVDVWMIAHWNDCGSEASWRIKHGSSLLWPRQGVYYPVNAWQERGQLPTEDLTDKVIECVRQVRSEKELKRLEALAQAAMDAKEREESNLRRDIIDECQTLEFGVMPGSRAGNVSIFTEPLQEVTI